MSQPLELQQRLSKMLFRLLVQVRVNLWDLAGPPEYLEVRNEFYKDSQAALLVYDVTHRASFEALGTWLEEAQRFGTPSNMVSKAGQRAPLAAYGTTHSYCPDWCSALPCSGDR